MLKPVTSHLQENVRETQASSKSHGRNHQEDESGRSWLLHCDLRVISRDFGFVSSLFLSLSLLPPDPIRRQHCQRIFLNLKYPPGTLKMVQNPNSPSVPTWNLLKMNKKTLYSHSKHHKCMVS